MHIFLLCVRREIGPDPWGKPFPSNGMETATRYFSVVLAYIYKCKNSRCNVIPGHFQPGASNGVPSERRKDPRAGGWEERSPATFQDKGSSLSLSLDWTSKSGQLNQNLQGSSNLWSSPRAFNMQPNLRITEYNGKNILEFPWLLVPELSGEISQNACDG